MGPLVLMLAPATLLDSSQLESHPCQHYRVQTVGLQLAVVVVVAVVAAA